ncbi:MAG: ABC transporter permease [Euryarchaeota archaeon]|nr:ABC transporter permease [Euryarchaeota archaeon]
MIAREWDKTLITALTTPAKPFEIVLGYVLAGVVQALVACAVFIVLMSYIVDISFGCIPLIILFIIVTAAFFSSLAVVTAMWLDNLYQQVVFTFLVIIPMIFFCGTFIPITDLPNHVQPVIEIIPLTVAVQAVRMITLSTENPYLTLFIIFWDDSKTAEGRERETTPLCDPQRPRRSIFFCHDPLIRKKLKSLPYLWQNLAYIIISAVGVFLVGLYLFKRRVIT